MFPELRYIWKVLENPTGRSLGQKSSFSHAIQEALHKMFALQDSPAQEPSSKLERRGRQRSPLGTGASGEHVGSYSSHVPTRELRETMLVKAQQKNRTHPGSLRERI